MPQGREPDPIHGYNPMSMKKYSQIPLGERVPEQQVPKIIIEGREGASQWINFVAEEVRAGHGSLWAVE